MPFIAGRWLRACRPGSNSENVHKELENFLSDLEAGWDKIVFAALSDDHLNKLKNKISESFGAKALEDDKVGFMKLKTFLKSKKA